MADNKINVTVSANTRKNITVSSTQQSTEITASADTGRFWAQTSKNWAVSDVIVENTDYSSKYYANQAKESASNAEEFESAIRDVYNGFLGETTEAIENVQGARDEAIANIETSRVEAVDSINSTKTTILSDIEFVADGEKQEIQDIIDNGKDELKESIGDVKVLTTLEIGDIGIAPLGIDETKGKRRYLNGQVIIQEQYVQFTNKVKSAVALYPSLACTEEEWQTTATMTVGGQVGKFVVDDEAGTIRLPKIIMPIQGLTDLSKLGEIVEAGLPSISHTHTRGTMNITGSFGAMNEFSYADGAFYLSTEGQRSTGSYADGKKVNFNASRKWTGSTSANSAVSAVYGKSNTVQQEQIQYPYFIQVATGVETEDNIINEIELNNPYSFGDSKYSPVALNNISWLKSEGQWNSKAVYPDYYDWILANANNGVADFKLVTDTYDDYSWVLNTTDETFRLPLLNGEENLSGDYFEDIQNTITKNTDTICTKNGHITMLGTSNSTNGIGNSLQIFNVNSGMIDKSIAATNAQQIRLEFEVSRNDVVQYSWSVSDNSLYIRFSPYKGNGSLYFYVGETVQNANLINAGRVFEVVQNINSQVENDLYYRAGDVFELKTILYTAGVITSSAQAVCFSIPVEKSLENITTITPEVLVVGFRKDNGGYMPSDTWDVVANADNIIIYKPTNNTIYIRVVYSNFGGVNNTPVGVGVVNLRFRFS